MKKQNEKIKGLEAKITELTAGWQRTQADFINFKNQIAKERVELIERANSDLIYELLPILDNFSLAAKHIPKELEGDNWAQGISQIEKQFENILRENGLERIESLDTKFDPNLHEAIEEVESDKPHGTIVEEVLPGYKLNDTTIRPAKVKVSK
ncbi:nucleotide exchange factor GrpE [Candidatus Berkelbacteria bacterium RIFOXYA2_FULL_43_10]|uniref:Protein GrpE n=1 Tax=Candidatus Berkelbacteria bacterium RIFOXYA2_FULL_43_10 TaxID=1797472 RepID=A0A1F5E8S8_9BACT|nr:MAG: nucleotide exchange factor GrpE [Candidatus Berkelbacteria bacterium RIFOXYA2_FULL_43_10]